MSGYLDNYGAADVQRERTRGRIVKWGAAALALALALYFVFHFVIPNRGEREVARFFQLLAARDYRQATPCGVARTPSRAATTPSSRLWRIGGRTPPP